MTHVKRRPVVDRAAHEPGQKQKHIISFVKILYEDICLFCGTTAITIVDILARVNPFACNGFLRFTWQTNPSSHLLIDNYLTVRDVLGGVDFGTLTMHTS